MGQSVYFLHVGANIDENDGLSPLFEDGTFEYIPGCLPKGWNSAQSHNHRHYSLLGAQNTNLKGMHHSSFVNEDTAFLNPEFYSFTYAEIDKKRLPILKKATAGDLLVFVSTLQKYKSNPDEFTLTGKPALYVIGYFKIQNVSKSFKNIQTFQDPHFENCCHDLVLYREKHIAHKKGSSALLFRGHAEDSCLLQKPLKVGTENQFSKTYEIDWRIDTKYWNSGLAHASKPEVVMKKIQRCAKDNRWVGWAIP